MHMREGQTIWRIRDAVCREALEELFSPKQVNDVLGIHWGGNFLAKHRVGNPGGNTELFVRISFNPALYRLNERGQYQGALLRPSRHC